MGKKDKPIAIFGQVDGGKKFIVGEAIIKPLTKEEAKKKYDRFNMRR